jgi:hypothetical protein
MSFLKDYFKILAMEMVSSIKYDGVGPFLSDENHAKPFNPQNTPVRQKFNGYANFYFNGDVSVPGITDMEKVGDQTVFSSMIKNSDIPSAEMATDVKNQYNKKRITVTHAEFKPISMSAYDTVDSAWVLLLMKMYAHLFTNPMGQYESTVKTAPDPADATKTITTTSLNPKKIPYDVVPSAIPTGSTEGPTYGFNSQYSDNNMGYNLLPGSQKYFLNHIDIVMFHSQRSIVYTMFNPIVTGFTVDGFDHSSSDPVMVNMDISYENFSVKPLVNSFIPEADMERFFKGGGSKTDYELLRSDTEVSGHVYSDGMDPRKQASLKEKKALWLTPGEEGGDQVSRYSHDQSTSDFWKAIGGSS